MAYLLDTDAISELFRKRPLASYVRWLEGVPREDQFTSAITVGELYRGAFASHNATRHLDNIEKRVLPALVVLPYDVAIARIHGEIGAALSKAGKRLADADLQIAATALHHGLQLVTGNLRRFSRVPGLSIHPALATGRRDAGT